VRDCGIVKDALGDVEGAAFVVCRYICFLGGMSGRGCIVWSVGNLIGK